MSIVHSALGKSLVFSGALIAIQEGIKRKSLAPLVFYGTTCPLFDILMGITTCNREPCRTPKLPGAQNSAVDASLTETVCELDVKLIFSYGKMLYIHIKYK